MYGIIINKRVVKKSLLLSCLLSSFVLMGLGQPIFGEGSKFSISNIVELFTVFLLIFLGYIKVKDVIWISLLSVFVFFSLFNILIVYDLVGKIIIVVFVITSLIYCIGIYRYVRLSVEYNDFYKLIRKAIYIVLPLYISIGLYEYFVEGQVLIAWGMDDKAHAAIILCFFSFLCVSHLNRLWLLYAFLFLLCSFLTVSRLPVIFFPFLMIAILRRIYENQGRKAFFVAGSIILFIAIIFMYILFEYNEIFLLANRINSINTVSEEGSTNAHLLLISKAVELKIQNIGNLIFGISPGAFDIVLLKSGIPVNDIAGIDYEFIENARIGKAPMHSTHAAVFCEYALPVFIMYLYIISKRTYELWKYKLYNGLLFWMGFLLSITFYSSHNKFYFYVIVVYIYSIIWFRRKDALDR